MQLEKILDIAKWQSLQDSLAISTRLAIITVDFMGAPVTRHSEPRPFCKMIRGSMDLEGYCRKCDSRGGLEAVRLKKPYIYLCHRNIVDVAVPIIVAGKYVGAVMAGEVRVSDADNDFGLEKILLSPRRKLLQNPNIRLMYNAIPAMPLQEIEIATQLISDLCQYIVGEAMNRNLMLELYEKFFPHNHVQDNLTPEGYNIDAVYNAKKELECAATNIYVESSAKKKLTCTNPVLQPAFNYIYQNKGENVTQTKAAGLCHLSAGYFGRLFMKETGEKFTRFMSRQKVEWAKLMLERTEYSVAQISEELGFGEPGYFIKTFKKLEAITPAIYRRYYRENAS